MVKINLLNCIVMSLFITAMTTYFFRLHCLSRTCRFFVLLFGFLCLGINITISIFFISKLCCMRVCMCIYRYIHCIHYAIYSDLHIISNFMYILHQILCYYY